MIEDDDDEDDDDEDDGIDSGERGKKDYIKRNLI